MLVLVVVIFSLFLYEFGSYIPDMVETGIESEIVAVAKDRLKKHN
jgi:uncharacterized membrane protein